MEYDKKILVLKQVTEGFSITGKSVSGIFRLEIESGVATFSVSVINLTSVEGGCFYLFIMDDNKKLYTVELGKRPFSQTGVLEVCPSVKKCLSVGVSFIKDDIPTLIAYACENGASDVAELRKVVIDKCINDRKLKPKLEKPEKVEKPAPITYDDEVVATENYYENDGALLEKISLIESFDNENVRSQDGKPDNRGEEKEKEEFARGFGVQNETDCDDSQKFNEQNPYYRHAKPELDALFLKFPEEEGLTRAVMDSKWIRIHYSETRYYVVGLVKEKGKERYICYGVPAKYSLNPPDELKGFCSFIPLSVFDLKGDGYWMMFQDAVTGECVKING